MYIIIIGGGKIGYHLGKALLEEEHEVLIIENNAARSTTLREELGSACVRGDGCEATTLTAVGTSRADMFIAVTGDDEDNLVACQLARHKFKVPRLVARINNPKNETIFNLLGITDTISSTNIILEYIKEEVPTHPLTHLLTSKDKGFEIVEVKVPPNAPTVGKKVEELVLPPGSVLSLIIRKGEGPFVPEASTIIQPDDQVIAAINPESEKALRTALRGA